MSPLSEDDFTIDDQTLDQVVDGELDTPRRRRILGQLDRTSDGWRRLGLAFLQAQALREDLATMTRPPNQQLPSRSPRRRSRRRSWAAPVAMAAGLLIGLGLGAMLPGVWPAHRPGPAGIVAVDTPPPAPPAASAAGPVSSGVGVDRGEPPAASSPHREPPVPWKMVTLSVDDGAPGGRHSIRIPAVEHGRLDDGWLRRLPAAVSPRVIAAFRAAGHEVRQHRQLLPVEMDDGRELVVPVDEVELRYVGHRAY